ncbi:hypothetical protein GCM10020001_098740 [Nonomuraea salmonea]
MRCLGKDGDEPLDGVVVATGLDEVVPVDAAGVGEQVAGGQVLGGGLVAQPEPGQVVANRTIEIQCSVIDQLLDQCRRPDLRDRADLEHRIGRGLDLGTQTQHPRSLVPNLPIGQYGDLRARYVVLRNKLTQVPSHPEQASGP